MSAHSTDHDGVRDLEWAYLEKVCRAASTLDAEAARDSFAAWDDEQFSLKLLVFYLELLTSIFACAVLGHDPQANDVPQLVEQLHRRWHAMLGRSKDTLAIALRQAFVMRAEEPRLPLGDGLAQLTVAAGILARDLGWQDWTYIRRLFAVQLAPFEMSLRQKGVWGT